MIEFKAACGHTVRARDEDAGGIARCSYCGRQVDVPNTQEDNLDFLFRDSQNQEDTESTVRRRRWFLPRRPFVRGQLDPSALIMWMCYAAALLIVGIVVVREGIPRGRELTLTLWERFKPDSRGLATDAQEPDVADQRAAEDGRLGLTTLVTPPGIYVASTPPGAAVYVAKKSDAPPGGRINEIAAHTMLTNDQWLNAPDGEYIVEVALPWHHASLMDKNLPNYEGYCTFRRAVEEASADECARLVDEYFLPDKAWPVFIDKTEDQRYIVRQYRNVVVRERRSKGVRALFLPRIAQEDGSGFSLTPLVTHYIPAEEVYTYDRRHAVGELEFYEVPASQWAYILDALTRIGVIPYLTPDGRTRMFKIGLEDGVFAAEVIREAIR